MLQDRMNGLATLSIENEMLKLLYDNILINNFAAQKATKK
jgi:hypothetical protein